MPFFTDQLNRTIELKKTPERIISLVPSQTELLYDLGLDNEVIGITKFCIHPAEWYRTKKRIGGTKTLNIKEIKELKPDLLIANKEENIKEQVEELACEFPTWISDVNNLPQALQMIEQIGEITNTKENAHSLVQQIKKQFANYNEKQETRNEKLRTAYLIWKDPYMSVGGDTFIHNMLTYAGFQNVFADKNRYPETTIEELRIANCELMLLSSEPFPFKQKHIDELQKHLPTTKIFLADGELFSWYGSRLLHTPAYFQKLQIALIA
jgi:ABC-type Fe3+-hydroxamate transport system substrate-binding protein